MGYNRFQIGCVFAEYDLFKRGLGVFLVERSFFPKNQRNDQERSHHSKKNERLERILKNIGTISIRTE